ncbi:hypothetical protein FNYG_11652 [Fusarium nygamai]|uniref:Uncharacterized protein n=1 Tax=Gibberella nygamai TaxID=42673 RepID=A0A2K0VYA7_GIBNY|nr:hypothetical protein FNYG_11652 [Fusarium nygamai]
MSVYSETTKPSFKVSFKDWRDIDLDDDELSLPTLVSACERGAKVFTLILRDLQGELERHADIPEVIAQDAKDLIALVSFYFHGPLRAVLNTSERWDVMQNSYSRVFDGLHESVRLVQSILDRPSAPARIVQNMEASSRSKSIVEISSRSPIELLLRAVTAHQRWDRLGMNLKAFKCLQESITDNIKWQRTYVQHTKGSR